VALSKSAVGIGSAATATNFVRVHDLDEDVRELVMLNRVTHGLCRMAADSDEPVLVFLSHAKRDGVELTTRVKDFLESGTGVRNFFDAQDILEGTHWAEVIRDSASTKVLLAVRTDAYATREWCRTEVLEAKLGGAPVVVLDALETSEQRGFPYLGNAPAVRWRGDASAVAMEELLGVVLRETLRFRHFPVRVDDLCSANGISDAERVLPAPPELLTVLRARDAEPGLLVYPDPPLGPEELALVADLAPGLTPVTPTALVGRR
jgi:hypothetical protein